MAGMSMGQYCVKQNEKDAAAAAPAVRLGIVVQTLDLNSAAGAQGSAFAVADTNTMHFGYFASTGHLGDAERSPGREMVPRGA